MAKRHLSWLVGWLPLSRRFTTKTASAVFTETVVSDEYTGLKHAFQGQSAVFVHGQKKRRKRTLDGSIPVDGNTLSWSLLSEPLWSTEHGYVGLRIAVRAEDEAHRELILEYPFPKSKGGSALPLPQRPAISAKAIEADIRQAMVAGWDPNSRGKAFVYQVIASSTSVAID